MVPGLAFEMSSGVAEKMQDLLQPDDGAHGWDHLTHLQAAIVRLESQKQDSVTGEFERMAKALEQSISQALSNMGREFRDALSGSARDEFGNVQGTLETTRHVISEMNTQFAQMQTALGVIIAKVEETTTDQLKAGREQTEALNALMHGLDEQASGDGRAEPEQRADTAHARRQRFDRKSTGLSVDMMDAAKDMASHSQQSASTIIEKTDAWSEATAKRLEALLANIENRSQDFKEAGAALLEAKTFMSNLLTQNANALAQMADASRNVQAYTSGLVGQSDALKGNQRGPSQGRKPVAADGKRNKGIARSAREAAWRIPPNGHGIQAVIDTLHEPLARIMQATSNGLRDYNQSVERNFTKIVEVADKLVPKAANLLSGQIEDLGEPA